MAVAGEEEEWFGFGLAMRSYKEQFEYQCVVSWLFPIVNKGKH